MKLHVGTSGYSYKPWKGSFYPEDLPAKKMLAYYASKLPAVEINNTFYALPRASVLEGWAQQVPGEFRFAIKASRRITHVKKLVGAEQETAYLLDTAGRLEQRLGCVLFQLPPFLELDLARLDAFLERIPEGTRAAFEFRHASWDDAAVSARLAARDFARVAVDLENAAPALAPGASWGYLRLRAPGYERGQLAAWAQAVHAQGWQEAFVFFKHEDAGHGPRLAAELLELAERVADRRPARAVRPAAKRRTGRAGGDNGTA
jgi:uncharacterized protein YecE (DUF72 family)